MAQWGNRDHANNAPKWAGSEVKLTPNTGNKEALYQNTTADSFMTGTTDGIFAVNSGRTKANPGVPHTGWVHRKVGSGGRANRIQTEVLVAGGITNASADQTYAEYRLTFTSQQANATVNTNSATTLAVVAAVVPTDTIAYQWQANTGSGMANLSNAGVYSNVTTATMSISNTNGLNAVSYRCFISVNSGTNTNTSSNAYLTVV